MTAIEWWLKIRLESVPEDNIDSTPQNEPINKLPISSETPTVKCERKIKESGYRLDLLTAYNYDLIELDDNINKEELVKKLNDAIDKKSTSNSSAAIALLNGVFFTKTHNLKLEGLSINNSVNKDIKDKINTHGSNPTIGYFFNSSESGISVEHHGNKENKKYLFKWILVKQDGTPGKRVYEQIIDLS
ncbi:MAG1890 family putative lipoprotein [Mycoplasmopsis agalactiae]|uniref:MAG1890 family putative lipoprotein n=1 Tax=Mycoplasmopsis agalactiae TaxID=2110 RepID=UPI003DA1C9D0